MSHLGARVSALLDGRLPPAEEERCWEHVHSCHPCRDLVEREGWVKTRLAGLSFDGGRVPAGLKDSLMCPTSALAPERFPTAPRSRHHRGLALLGGGAAGAAVVGVLALGAVSTPQIERRAPVSDLNRPTTTSSVVPRVRPTRRAVRPTATLTATPRPSGQVGPERHLPREVAARGTMTR